MIARALITAGALALGAANACAQVTPGDAPNPVSLDNEYVHVARDSAPCADAATGGCEDRIIVAYGPVEVSSGKKQRRLAKGQVAVF